MTNEQVLNTPPAWLELPDEQIEPKKVTLWSCTGSIPVPPKVPFFKRLINGLKKKDTSESPSGNFILLYPTKEEAEAGVLSNNGETWVWDKEPASPQTLSYALHYARSSGYAGVKIKAYRNGQWKIIRTFPVEIPYMGESEYE